MIGVWDKDVTAVYDRMAHKSKMGIDFEKLLIWAKIGEKWQNQ